MRLIEHIMYLLSKEIIKVVNTFTVHRSIRRILDLFR